jgi:hypothetical protein
MRAIFRARSLFLVLLLAAVALPCEWDYPIWIPRSPTADPLYRFEQGDKTGYIDQAGKIVIPPKLEHLGGNYAGEFHDGRLEIGVSDGAYVDTSGKKVIDKGFYRGWDFSEGLAVAMRKGEDKWGYIDKNGEFVISPRFPTFPKGYVSSFTDGFAKIELSGKVGYIDHSGEFAIAPRFLEGESFHDGMARVIVEGPCSYFQSESPCPSFGTLPRGSTGQLPDCKYTFIDKSGLIITDQRFEDARDFGESLAPVQVAKYWGYIDKTGTKTILPRFDTAAPFADGLALVSERHQYGFIDRAGVYVIRPQFEYAENFAEGRAVVSDGDSFWYIDHDGQPAIPGTFERASSFFKGLAHVKLQSDDEDDETFAYINRNGHRVFVYKREMLH